MFNSKNKHTLVIQNYGNKSQEVPFYSWMLAKKTKTIFGNDGNDWGTNQSNFVSKRYQSLERIKPNTNIENYTRTDYFSDSLFDLSYSILLVTRSFYPETHFSPLEILKLCSFS